MSSQKFSDAKLDEALDKVQAEIGKQFSEEERAQMRAAMRARTVDLAEAQRYVRLSAMSMPRAALRLLVKESNANAAEKDALYARLNLIDPDFEVDGGQLIEVKDSKTNTIRKYIVSFAQIDRAAYNTDTELKKFQIYQSDNEKKLANLAISQVIFIGRSTYAQLYNEHKVLMSDILAHHSDENIKAQIKEGVLRVDPASTTLYAVAEWGVRVGMNVREI